MRIFWHAVMACLLIGPGHQAQAAKAEQAEAALLKNIRQITFEGRRAGEGYFSADGSKMIFQSEREPGNPFYQMYMMDMTSGDVVRLSPGHGKTTCGWLHPGGSKAIFASTQDDPKAKEKQKKELAFRASGKRRRYSWDYDKAFDIFEYDMAGGVYRNLTKAPGYDAEGAYSPDGRSIVFASNRQAYARKLSVQEQAILARDKSYFMDIYIMNADGSDLRRLTRAPGYDGGAFFSSDGSKILWRRFSEDGARAEVYTMNVDGSDKRQITRLGAMSWAPFFHPSGDYIIFATNLHGMANFELYLVDAAGRKDPVRVTHYKGFDGLAAFSPDGKRLAWASKRTSDGSSQIVMADWDDGAARRLLGLAEKKAKAAGNFVAGAPVPQMQKTKRSINVADLKLHLGALASREMAGRLTGTAGEIRATDYVAKVFAALGLQPAGDDGSYFQSFPFTAGVSLGTGNSLGLTTASGSQSPQVNRDWRPLAFSHIGEVKAAGAVFAGFGIVAPGDKGQPAYDSYDGLDVTGKWVLVFRGLPKDIGAKRRIYLSRYQALRYKASVARANGAKGLIVAPAPGLVYKDELVRLTYEASVGSSTLPAIAVSNLVVKTLVSPIASQWPGIVDKLNAGEAVKGRALPDAQITAHIELAFERRTGRNVLARLKTGADPKAPLLIVGAHVDHLGRGETSGSLARGDEKGQIHFGADDNASGVAAVIEIAQNLAAEQTAGRLDAKRDILFAAWSGEELGLLGSSYFVKDLAKRAGTKTIGKKVSAYLNLDMVGRLRTDLKLLGLGSAKIWKREVERRNLPIGLSIRTSNDTYLPTDATSFYLKGVPILAAYTGAHKDYSTPRDTADKINYPGLEKVARLMALIARSQARAIAAPTYIKQTKSGRGRARRRSSVTLGTIPDYAAQGAKGVPISGVLKAGPADKAGMKGGDVIVGLGGSDIENIYDFVRIINGLKAGEATELVVTRNGRRVKLSISPAPRE